MRLWRQPSWKNGCSVGRAAAHSAGSMRAMRARCASSSGSAPVFQ
jgi:hypothetical protein